MHKPYRIRIRQPARRRWAFLLLVAGALCLYIASFSGKSSRMTIEPSGGVLVTREQSLPEQCFYAVSLFSSPELLCAQTEAARYASRGAAGVVLAQNGLYHSVGAIFPAQESAERHAAALHAAEGIDAQVVALPLSPVLLRVTATQRQLDALLQAEALGRQAALRLGEIALRIDSGAIDLAGAQSLLDELHGQLAQAGEALAQKSIGGGEPVCERLAALLREAAQEAERLAGLESPARLLFSSAVRALQAELFMQMSAWRAQLGA